MLHNRNAGDELEIFVRTVQTEHETFLYGFTDEESLELFDALTGIQGIGAKIALSILDAMSCSEIVRTIRDERREVLGKVKGVGPKTAGRIVSELSTHPFVTSFILPVLENQERPTNAIAEALEVLVSLGYKRQEAQRGIEAVLKNQPNLSSADLVVVTLRAGMGR
jgi:Holliday junction DNA helicase RuvA